MGVRVLVIAVTVAAGCGASPSPGAREAAAGPQARAIDLTGCGDEPVAVTDTNGDGRADTWAGATCHLVDLDHDGRIDVRSVREKGNRTTVRSLDFDADGVVDIVVHEEDGERRVERRLPGGRRIDERYAGDRLVSREIDRNGDGRPDQWEHYPNDAPAFGLYDDDFDGRVDRRETIEPIPAGDETAGDGGAGE